MGPLPWGPRAYPLPPILLPSAQVEAGSERLQQRLTRLEAGYGLAEAAAEIELLHDAILRRDADIARLSQSAGTQLDMHDALLEIAQRLAER